MNSTNMLSANKVKLHGMTSTKWTTRDKITQYKGLINLYTRDKKIIEMDTLIAQKKQARELKMLQKQIEQNRRDLDNAIRGDKQKLRNTLAEHRTIQLAYQNSQPEKVIDMVNQVNFTKRKARDILKYRMKVKSDDLINLKLQYASYEDRLRFEGISWTAMLPCERQAHSITGKVQDALLKKQAAIYIRNSYKEMIAIMKKDALYFDAILVSIHNDALSQGKCMINATKHGQLGTEYLDDRRQEFQLLEKVVKRDMLSRKKDLAGVQRNVENFEKNLRNLLRRDSDVNLGRVNIESSMSVTILKDEMNTVESTLTFLKKSIFTPTIESIFPCIKEQLGQKERLNDFVAKCERNRDDLLNRTEHATLMKSRLENTMVDTTKEYSDKKSELMQNIKAKKSDGANIDRLIQSRRELLAKVCISLRHIHSLTGLMNSGDKNPRSLYQVDDEQIPPDPGTFLVELAGKFSKLAANAKEFLTGRDLEEGYCMFELMMNDRMKKLQIEEVFSEESLIETVFMDSHVLSRDDIKKQSAEIVALNAVSEDVQPDRRSKKKRFKFK